MQSAPYDAIVVGGSYAGLSAATQLARARRRILVIDGGQRRNRPAEHAHGFLTQDGTPPGEIAALGRQQLLAYDTVEWLDAAATEARATTDGFEVNAGGRWLQGRRLLLAGGIRDILPPLPGLAERWGKHVFHCPYCHGYELNQGRIGVLASSSLSMHLALMLPDWGPTTLLLNEAFEPDAEQLQQLQARGVQLERTPVTGIEGTAEVRLSDGRSLPLDGLFITARTEINGNLAAQLGCAMEDHPLGPYIRTDAMQSTSVPGVFACGDAARPGGSVAAAVGQGAMAGAAAHQSLIFGLNHGK